MLDDAVPKFLLASHEPALLAALEPVLRAQGGDVEITLSAESALRSMTAHKPPALALLDATLPGLPITQLVTSALSANAGRRFPLVLVSASVTSEWQEHLSEGIIDDILSPGSDASWWRIRIELVMRKHRLTQELESLREAAATSAQLDHLTGVYNREALLAILFRETDRVQRQKNCLCTLLFDIDDFGHWNSRLGAEACDELLRAVVARSARLLRSYDALGRLGKDEFLIVLPGCAINNASMLADRLRQEVFGMPFRLGRESIRLSACFGIANSLGRSPVVVLREAEQAVLLARQTGPETIQCFIDSLPPSPAPVFFVSASSGDDLLAW